MDYGAFAARVPLSRQKAMRNIENISESVSEDNSRPSKKKNCFKCGSTADLCEYHPKKKFNDKYQP